jgi:hypothetical protein
MRGNDSQVFGGLISPAWCFSAIVGNPLFARLQAFGNCQNRGRLR